MQHNITEKCTFTILAPLKTVCFTLKYITEVSKLIYQLMSMKSLGKVFSKLLTHHKKDKKISLKKNNKF